MISFKRLLLLILLLKYVIASQLETVNDDSLVELIKNEKYVVVLFSNDKCKQCDEIEKELVNIRDDLVESLGSWVVKSMNSQLVRLYDPTKEPAIVFFRHGVPLLYEGTIHEDEILHYFMDNKDPLVKELADDSFEHLTQAATGATTGDWLVMFYSTECVDCQRLGARWEAVAAKIKSRVNVARVNKATSGAATARRFGVHKVPSFLLFHQGKMYRYNLPKQDIKSFVSFAQEWYKNAKAETVPLPKAPFDDLVAWVVEMIRDVVDQFNKLIDQYPWLLYVVFGVAAFTTIGFSLVLITAVISKFKASKPAAKKKQK
uniref:Putative thioredoxin domain-containing protein n=1 Tax=Xenopsylla cheopis TaxID=163159 RepID=A0A6M2DWL0_XENCH